MCIRDRSKNKPSATVSGTGVDSKRSSEQSKKGLESSPPKIAEMNEEAGDFLYPSEPVHPASFFPQPPLQYSDSRMTNIQSPLVVINNYGIPSPYPGMYSMQYNPMMYPMPSYYPMMAMPNTYFPEGGSQYVEYSPGIFYPINSVPRAIPQPKLVNLNTTKAQDEIINSLLSEIAKSLNDQSSCRLLQKKLEEDSTGRALLASKLFQKMIDKIGEYMKLPFGNYLCQKLFEIWKKEELQEILTQLGDDIVAICNNIHGTRSIQQLFEQSAKHPELHKEISKTLSGHIAEIIIDINGNHVVQLCLKILQSKESVFLYEEVTANCLLIATQKHGCCVLQKCLDIADPDNKGKLIEKIVQNCLELVQDQYGNYVVQYIIDLKRLAINSRIADKLKGSILHLSNKKYSSNVIEKLLENNEKEKKEQIIDEVLTVESYLSLLLDPYGNYVIQKALDFSTEKQRHFLLKKIKPDMKELKLQGGDFGKKIAAKLFKAYPMLEVEETEQEL
eukprot:TRINITY_DN3143_c0_g1_i2.p1 TRINITY_DN3143_c0_g1~~TRINITY_DN3143_c0_g1_i2.p1  ORF type:complete len:522 (-),score=86.42 TRINITY_DN3143_c0_g1_i2:4-1512(-)